MVEYRKTPKGLVFNNGARVNHGQLFTEGKMASLDKNSPLHPRNGAPKRAASGADIPVKPGMRSRIAPSHEFLHGAPLQDEPLEKTYTAPIGYHTAMTDKQIAMSGHGATSSQVLHEAAKLGRKS
jgi:hypothetical protein